MLYERLHVHALKEPTEPRVGQQLLVQQVRGRLHRRPATQALVDGLGASLLCQDGPIRALRTQSTMSLHASGACTAGRPPSRW